MRPPHLATVLLVALLAGCSGSNAPESRKQQLKDVAIYFHVYAESHEGRFLPEDYEPGKSNWREHVLEVMNTEFEFDGAPPTGAKLFTRPEDGGKTRYLLVTGPGTLFDFEEHPADSIFTTVETGPIPGFMHPLCVVVGADEAVPWDEPVDFILDPENPREGLGEQGESIFYLAVDGSIQKLPANVDDDVLLAFLQSRRPIPPDVLPRFKEAIPFDGAFRPDVELPE